MSATTENLVDVGFNPRRAEAIEAAILQAVVTDAGDVAFTPAGGIEATDVQAAIEELDTEKVPATRALTAGDGLTGGGDLSADRSFAVGAGTGITVAADAVGLTDMAEATFKGRAAGAGTGAPTDLSAAQARAIIGPGLVLLNSGTVTSQATLDIVLTGFTAYRAVLILLTGFVPATDDVELWMRFSTDGGSNYDATGYSYALAGLFDNTASSAALSASAAQIVLAGITTGTAAVSNQAAEGGVDCQITLHGRTTARWTRARISTAFHGALDVGASQNGHGQREAAQDTDAVRFLFESGDIASGDWALYGYA